MISSIHMGSGRWEQAGISGNSGTAITANATAGSDGAYTQIIASTGFDYDGLYIWIGDTGALAARDLIDVSIGAAAAEQVIVPDLQLTSQTTTAQRCSEVFLWVPIHVPSASRIAARVHRSNVASAVAHIVVAGYGGHPRTIPAFQRCTSYGSVIANAAGTKVTPSLTTYSASYTQLVASTTNPIRMFYVLAHRDGTSTSTPSNLQVFKIGIGAAASEQAITPELNIIMDTSDDVFGTSVFGPFFCDIPAGTRLSANSHASDTTAASCELDLVILGLD